MSQKITDVITLGEYAERHALDVKRLRRAARKNEFPGEYTPFKWGGKNGLWAIDATAPEIVLPPKSQRGARRADGRQRHIVFATVTELVAVRGIVGNDNVVDPRVAAKQRRDARKNAVKCHFCDNVATQKMACDDNETHDVCDGCANAWNDDNE